jgi:hypothetical protein
MDSVPSVNANTPLLVTVNDCVTVEPGGAFPRSIPLPLATAAPPLVVTATIGVVIASMRTASAITYSLAASVSFTANVEPVIVTLLDKSFHAVPPSVKSPGVSSWFTAAEAICVLPSQMVNGEFVARL